MSALAVGSIRWIEHLQAMPKLLRRDHPKQRSEEIVRLANMTEALSTAEAAMVLGSPENNRPCRLQQIPLRCTSQLAGGS